MFSGSGKDNSSAEPIGNTDSLFTCTNQEVENRIARGRITTLLSYFILMTLATMFMATATMTFDAIVLKMMKEHDADYGLQKIWGIIGASIFSPVSGLLMGVFGDNYVIGFYIYGALKLFCVVFIMFFPLTATLPSENLWKGIKSVVKNGESSIFMLNMFLMGSIWGFLEGFLFFFMEEIGSPKYVMGLTNTVAGISCLPIIFLSGHILNKIGHAQVLIITFFVYAIRLLAYSFVWNPYLCLIIEISEAFTSNLMAVASVTYAGLLAPPSLRASIQGLLTAVHYGIGRGCGQFIGGQLMANVGSRITFRVMAGIAAAGGTLYLLEYQGLLLWRRHQQRATGNKDLGRASDTFRHLGSPSLRNDGKVNRAFVFEGQSSPKQNNMIIPI
jgi:MFS family permease